MPNLKLAFRTLVKSPFVTLVAILSLALGIGANAAIFSLFNQLLLQPLPVAHPERLVNLSAPSPKPGSTSCNQAGDCEEVFSYPVFRDLERASNAPFSGIGAHRAFGANVAFDKQTFSGQGMLVSGSYFPVLGLKPALGRLFTPADDRNVGANYVAVLSNSYWESRLGSRKSVIGEPIIINGQTMTIIGVAPRGFDGTTLGSRPDVFVPITMRGLMEPYYQNAGFENRRSYWVYLFARLKPGVSPTDHSGELLPDGLPRTRLGKIVNGTDDVTAGFDPTMASDVASSTAISILSLGRKCTAYSVPR